MRRYIVITFLAVLLAAASVALLRKGKGMEINPAVRMLICERIISGDLIDVRDTPRLYLEYLEYWMECRDMPKTEDDLKGMLKHDPVQLTPEWEENIYEIELECERRLKDEPRGIEWISPSEMNHRVMFD